jgi:hypothetical protein
MQYPLQSQCRPLQPHTFLTVCRPQKAKPTSPTSHSQFLSHRSVSRLPTNHHPQTITNLERSHHVTQAKHTTTNIICSTVILPLAQPSAHTAKFSKTRPQASRRPHKMQRRRLPADHPRPVLRAKPLGNEARYCHVLVLRFHVGEKDGMESLFRFRSGNRCHQAVTGLGLGGCACLIIAQVSEVSMLGPEAQRVCV